MSKEELYALIEEKVNDIFYDYQTVNGIDNGDISPLHSLKLEEIQNDLAELIIEVGKFAMDEE